MSILRAYDHQLLNHHVINCSLVLLHARARLPLSCNSFFVQVMEQNQVARMSYCNWLCWFCPRLFSSQPARTHHMSAKHGRRNRLVPPEGFVELHLRPDAMDNTRSSAAVHSSAGQSAAGVHGATASSAMAAARESVNDRDSPVHLPAIGGLGVVRVPADGYMRGSLAAPRQRNVFQTSTAARIRAYYEAMPEASQTHRLVPALVGQRPSLFNTPLLREVLKFALSAGGPGLSQADQISYVSVLLMAERGGRSSRLQDPLRGSRPPSRARRTSERSQRREVLVGAADLIHSGSVPAGGTSSEDDDGEITRAFPNKTSFVTAVRAEQRRVLSKLCWDETPLEVEGQTYLFYSRDLLVVVMDLLQHARHVQFWGEQLGLGSDHSQLRADIMDSDLLLTEQLIVRRRHGSLAFVLAVQLFIDEAVVSWSGAHYMYPIRARVPNVRDRSVQWVTVGYVPHVGKPVARTSAARRRASDSRNGVLQRCLALLLRRFVGASQTGVQVHLPGSPVLTAVPRLFGIVADQLGERSVLCLMGNACQYFCSHCMVRRGVAGGPQGVGADARDVTAVLDAQMDGAITRDRDPRPSLRNALRTEYSALAFVPAVAAVWGLATDNKRLYDIISFDLLHVWKLGVVRMVAQRFPSFLTAACGGHDARLGPANATLEALNLRAWEMGHLCVPSPTPPGYVFPRVVVLTHVPPLGDVDRPSL